MSRSIKLVIRKGPNKGKEVVARGPRFTLGRDAGADLVLDGDQFVSRVHAEIVWSDGAPRLKNLSDNGTVLNGGTVTETALKPGDEISVGTHYVIGVEAGEEAPEPTRPVKTDRGARIKQTETNKTAKADKAATVAPTKKALSPLIVLYLVGIVVLFVVLGVMKLTKKGEVTLADIKQQEVEFATEYQLDGDDTQHVLRLLDLAAVHESRKDWASAYEVYRELLSIRRPPEPYAPAYIYAANRMASMTPEQ